MPIPVVDCAICGRQITKRSTLSLAFLGSDNPGRICRRHPEAEQLLAELAQKKNDERLWKEADRKLRIMIGVAAVRTLCSFKGFSPEMCYARLSWARLSPGDVQAIREEVDRLGGPIMSVAEMVDCILSATWVTQKQKELGL